MSEGLGNGVKMGVKYQNGVRFILNLVGGTGLEPVTPTVSL